ncbi:MAG: Spy/CpxP family protein refolding chaperone [Caulobacteraceae bacterium]|nr:Spy/CpxP family protein refolding chaperone [Caulobacteraceae bacterium]
MPLPVPSFPGFILPLAAAAWLAAGAALAQTSDVQPQLARLHAALKITADQESAWRVFAAASQPDPQQQAREQAAQQMLPKLTAPQRVDLSIAAMQADLDSLRQRGAALKAFYATLTPAQQAAFDRQTLPRGDDDR